MRTCIPAGNPPPGFNPRPLCPVDSVTAAKALDSKSPFFAGIGFGAPSTDEFGQPFVSKSASPSSAAPDSSAIKEASAATADLTQKTDLLTAAQNK